MGSFPQRHDLLVCPCEFRSDLGKNIPTSLGSDVDYS